ncbi:hypothetical protein B2J88_11905 [Rhodococcus sp. SRB_17]|uniref:hypothetical protein n=1 Tax=Acidovorax sp. SRB_24 TaxID=1962700 RepID=UPI00145FA211|nr:hypothetical protein [Acidovorax sp. SRB_24]NMM75545.1 hypothetical protein [Acidovorax sp. SRB_24]NMM85064.1 hypothetical protein [Rhodococcus sp. SRB_17]
MATHIYGLLSVVLSVVFFYVGFQHDPTWRDILLWAAGWMSAFMFALFLHSAMRSQKQGAQLHAANSETIGRLNGEVLALEEKVQRLKYELNRRNQTLDVVAGLGGMTAAKVREIVEGGNTDHG